MSLKLIDNEQKAEMPVELYSEYLSPVGSLIHGIRKPKNSVFELRQRVVVRLCRSDKIVTGMVTSQTPETITVLVSDDDIRTPNRGRIRGVLN